MSDGLDYVKTLDVEPTKIEGQKITWVFKNQPANSYGFIHYIAKVNDKAITEETVSGVANKYDLIVNYGSQQQYIISPEPKTNEVIKKDYNKDDKEADITDGSIIHTGETVAYKLYWANYTDEPADLKLVDTMSVGLDYIEGSSSDPSVVYDEEAHTLT